MKKFLNFIYSTRLMAVLFIVFALSMAVATFIENDFGTETARALVYNSWWFEAIMFFFVVNFFGNILKYKLYKKEKWVVLLFHLAFLFILIGAGISRYISFEGVMPIKEGEVSNTFFSSDNFISISVNDGAVQKTPFIEKVLLSAISSNNFDYKSNFKGTKIEVKLKNFIPHAQEAFEQNANGKTYLHFVESSSGSRNDHYIERGTSELIQGISVGYDTPSKNIINFKTVNDTLKFKSQLDGTFLRMSDKFNGIIKKDSMVKFTYLALHNIANLQFVVPSPPQKGMHKTVAGPKNSTDLSRLIFDVNVGNETKQVIVNGGQYYIQPPTLVKVGNLNFSIKYGAQQLTLPFSIKLRDFQLETYPGSQSAMSYASEVTVIDPDKTFDFRIFMNHILKFKGYKFFQSSYSITPEYEETQLSVNHDFWGSTITYLGYFMLFTGLIFILFMKNTRFNYLRKSLQKIRLKKAKLSLIVLILFTSFGYSQNHIQALSDQKIEAELKLTTVSAEHAKKFSRVIIQDAGGRMKPVDTYASELLRKVSKSDTYKNLNATQVFLSIQQNPEVWFQIPIIYLERGDAKLREILKLPEETKFATFSDFFNADGTYKLVNYQQAAQKSNIKNAFEKDIINVDRRVNLFYSALMGDVLTIFPKPNDSNNKWVSYKDLDQLKLKGNDSIFIGKLLPFYLQTLNESALSKNYSQPDQLLTGIIKFQKKYGKAVYPSERKINLEITYNKYNIFKTLYSYYMYIGTLLFFLLIIQIFNNNKVINFLVKAGIGIIILLFAMHTSGLIARWIVSGHAPWSNAYESMIYVGWATMLFGLIFGRKSSMTIAATAFLTAFILMIAHWNWMDPEIANLQPVLNSYWLMIHVAIIVASYGPFGLGMILGLISLILMILTTKKNKQKIGLIIKELTIVNEMSLTVGLVMITIGNFLGGMWANESWGRYWGWDPKETWALISIMVYAFVIHARLVPGLRSKFTFNLFSVVAFASILFTYFGVNFYLSGLHSYASGDKAITPNFVYYTIAIFFVIAAIAYAQFKKHYKIKEK